MTTTAKPYIYFVSYSHGAGFGSMEVHCARPVTQWSDIEGFARLVGARIWTKPDQVVVLNYQLLSGPEPTGAELQRAVVDAAITWRVGGVGVPDHALDDQERALIEAVDALRGESR